MLLEHVTGRELERGSRPKLQGRRVYLTFRDGQRALASHVIRSRLDDFSQMHDVDLRPVSAPAAFSPDGRSLWLISGCGVTRFDLESGEIDPLSASSMAVPQALTFSRDGKQLYMVSGAKRLTWDVATGRECKPRTDFAADFRNRAGM